MYLSVLSKKQGILRLCFILEPTIGFPEYPPPKKTHLEFMICFIISYSSRSLKFTPPPKKTPMLYCMKVGTLYISWQNSLISKLAIDVFINEKSWPCDIIHSNTEEHRYINNVGESFQRVLDLLHPCFSVSFFTLVFFVIWKITQFFIMCTCTFEPVSL